MSKKGIFVIVILVALIAGLIVAPRLKGISSAKLFSILSLLFLLAILCGLVKATRRRQKEGTGLPTDLSEPGEDTRR